MNTIASSVSALRGFRRGGSLLAGLLALALAGHAGVTLPTLTPSATTLTFSYTKGSKIPAAQTLTLKGSSNAKLTFTMAKNPDVDWLVVTPQTATTPVGLIVQPNPFGLSVGLNETDIVLTCSGAANSPVTVHVKLTVQNPPPTFTISAPTPIAYSTDDATFPAPQLLSIVTSGEPVSFTATVASAAWLKVSPASGISLQSSPAVLTVTVDPTGLVPNTYTGKITVASSNAATKTASVTITLVVSAGQAVLTKVWPPDVAVGSPDTTITLTGKHLFSISSVHIGTVDLTPTVIGTAADSLLVVVPATELKSQGDLSITVTNAPAAPSNALIWTVTPPGPRIWTVLNGASYNVPTATPVIAPGEIVSIFGTALGPDDGLPAPAPAAGGTYATRLGTAPDEVYVEFETSTGVWEESPLIYAQEGQVNAVVPFDMTVGTGKKMRATYKSLTCADFTVDVVPADPGIFTVSASGTGQAAVLNWNAGANTLNSEKTAVVRGDIIEIYATGGGATNPAPTVDGELVPTTGTLPHLVAESLTTVTIGTDTVAADYAGAVPGSIAGLVQINAAVPTTVKPGKTVQLLVTINGRTSPVGPTIAVK
jgi:uncharacterized protein (TIGR03437 family)